ncbi:uncharacterized protein G2W53_021493 [Senna tora]|uniref:Uncharacterized protein n=1 Tax=Senna tora TaxID=362788 RepID=A0A834TSY1_9FABA|nr:uncharacterized protein G2W53_021493 [Senna tora]
MDDNDIVIPSVDSVRLSTWQAPISEDIKSHVLVSVMVTWPKTRWVLFVWQT